MAKLRKACAYRRLERPYTRKSKYREKSYVRANPHNLIVKYEMGDTIRTEFPYWVQLKSESDIQLRHNAIESARKSSNKELESKLGNAYRFRVKVFPHHILRENPLASGAGADRMSTGMKMSFGKPIGLAARVRKGQTIFEVGCEEAGIAAAKKAMQRANYKFPCSTKIVVSKSTTKKA